MKKYTHSLNVKGLGTLEVLGSIALGWRGEWGQASHSVVNGCRIGHNRPHCVKNDGEGCQRSKGSVWRSWRDPREVQATEACRNTGAGGRGREQKHILPSYPEAICMFAQSSTGSSWWVWVCAQHAQSVDTRLALHQHAGGESNQNRLILQLANYEGG